MESKVRACIINASTGSGWYADGTKRLVRSLIHHGYAHDILTWNTWMNDKFSQDCPYNIKAAAWTEALLKNYEIILWLDCSVWAINYPYKVFDVINTEGYFFWKSEYNTNCAETVSDRCLQYFGVDRDKAESYPEISSGIFGIHVENPLANQFIERWLQSARDGQFAGSREHANQSADPRFKFHRQDQSCASMIIGQMGLKVHEGDEFCSYYPVTNDESTFAIRGL